MPTPVAYFHGLQSSPDSSKAIGLQTFLQRREIAMHVPDLRVPSFEKLSLHAALAAIDQLDAQVRSTAEAEPWIIVGSSLGGFLAACWAQRHPERVAALLLLCPAFNLAALWEAALGADAIATWQRDDAFALANAQGQTVSLHAAFLRECRELPAVPQPTCPIRLVHGRNDATVPLTSSQAFVTQGDTRHLTVVDDDHSLAASLPLIACELALVMRGDFASDDLEEMGEAPLTVHWDFFGPSAKPTAVHFLKHLDEFMAGRRLPPAWAGLDSRGVGHCEVWLRLPQHLRSAVIGPLRPHRIDESP